MTSGPLGGPRPLVDHILIADFEQLELYIAQVGPLGFPRPLAKPNPEVPPERVKECVMSRAGVSFGIGTEPGLGVDYSDFEELPPEQRVEILRGIEPRTVSWCEGILTSTSIPELDEDEIDELYGAIIEGELEDAAQDMDELEELDDEDIIDI